MTAGTLPPYGYLGFLLNCAAGPTHREPGDELNVRENRSHAPFTTNQFTATNRTIQLKTAAGGLFSRGGGFPQTSSDFRSKALVLEGRSL